MCRDHSVASQWDLICSRSWMLQLANSGFFLGSLGGLLLFQQVAEELGEQQPISPLLSFRDPLSLVPFANMHCTLAALKRLPQQQCRPSINPESKA